MPEQFLMWTIRVTAMGACIWVAAAILGARLVWR
jgi:hypothetical protein